MPKKVRLGTLDHNRLAAQVEVSPKVRAAVASIEELEATMAEIRVQLGDIAVGGEGDSVTAWIYALIAAAAIFYPVVIRPIRQRVTTKAPRHQGTKEKDEAED